LNAVTRDNIAVGVAHDHHLRALAEHAIRGEWAQLASARSAAASAMGVQAMVDALTVAAAFNGITRVADATGIPLDEATAQTTTAMRQDTGIQHFEYASKSQRYDG